MSEITSYRDLLAWQAAIDLVDLVYEITNAFPTSERFGLVQQMRRAAVSIPSNIAEGSRHSTAGYINRVVISLGEHAELETQAIISERRRYLEPTKVSEFNNPVNACWAVGARSAPLAGSEARIRAPR